MKNFFHLNFVLKQWVLLSMYILDKSVLHTFLALHSSLINRCRTAASWRGETLLTKLTILNMYETSFILGSQGSMNQKYPIVYLLLRKMRMHSKVFSVFAMVAKVPSMNGSSKNVNINKVSSMMSFGP